MGESRESKNAINIFQIMDEVIRQLNRTKKLFILMIISIVVVVPSTFIVTFTLTDRVFDDPARRGPPDSSAFGIARTVVIIFVLSWIVVGVRQWFVLSKWTQRYEIYKELQKKIDEKLDYDNNDDNNKNHNNNNRERTRDSPE